jgi:hypothetical protein
MVKPQYSLPKGVSRASVQIEFKRCGRYQCNCAQGIKLHGPYYYLRWREGCRQKKRYVPARQLNITLQAIVGLKTRTTPVSTIMRSLQLVQI